MNSYKKAYTNLYDETLRYLEAKFPKAGADDVMEAAAWVTTRTLVAVNDNCMAMMGRYETPVRRASKPSSADIERVNKRRAGIIKECAK